MSNIVDREESKSQKTGRVLGTLLSLTLAVAAFFAGTQFHISGISNSDTNQSANLLSTFFGYQSEPDEIADLSGFWRVWNLMDEKYVAASSTETTTQDRLYGAISGLVKSYDDPYTVFLPPTDAAQFGEDISGNFSGVGMEVGLRDGLITVISPLADTPAEKAGIMAGDVLVEIDGTSTEDMTVDEAVQLIRGEKGTDVVLVIYRSGATSLKEISVTRDTISIPTVKTEMKDGAFIISLYSFNALSEMKMQEALREYTRSGSKKLVLDLRGNPGGYLQSAVSIASYFLPAGEVVVREQFSEEQSEDVYRSKGYTLKQYAPEEMVVLVDGGSASASEILAGALQEHGVATLIGDVTFGKGSVQELIELPDGSSLKVTVARWLTPNGISISEGGLTPDVAIERTVEDIENDYDPQLEAAVNWVNGDKSSLVPDTTAFYSE